MSGRFARLSSYDLLALRPRRRNKNNEFGFLLGERSRIDGTEGVWWCDDFAELTDARQTSVSMSFELICRRAEIDMTEPSRWCE